MSKRISTAQFDDLLDQLTTSLREKFSLELGVDEDSEASVKAKELHKKILGGFLNDFVEEFAAAIEGVETFQISAAPLNPMQILWKNVIKQAERSIWTTNVKHPRDSFGRVSDQELINFQRSIVEKHDIEIQRVFIYDPIRQRSSLATPRDLMLAGELFDLRDVIGTQLHGKIQVFALSRSQFEKCKGATQYLGTDFMIVDNEFVYVTFTPKADDEPVTSKLLTGRQYVQDALEARKKIMASTKHLIPIKKELNTSKIFDIPR